MKQVKLCFVITLIALCFVLTNSCSQTSTNTTPSSAFNIMGYKWEQVLPFGNGSFQEKWKPGTFPMGIRPIIAFNENLWMIGQKSSWSSTDGIKWTQQNKNDWGERIYTELVFYKNKIWLFGGLKYQEKQFLNDVWVSGDGIKWELAGNAAWQPRGGHTIIVFKNKLWLFGGATQVLPDRTPNKFLNDIWSSEDGIHWTEEINISQWAPRDYPKVIVLRDTLYMTGGQGQADVWRSADGKNWNKLSEEAPWQKRYDYGSLVFDNKIWIFGGRDTSANHNTAAKNDVWFSDNGIIWNKQTEHALWTVRSGVTSIVFKNKLWIYSGKHTGGKHNWGGDVWTMSKDK